MPVGSAETARPRLVPRAIAFVALVCLAIIAVGGWREWSERDATLKAAAVELSNVARSLTQHAEDSIGLADSVLVGLVERLERRGSATSGALSSAVLATLRSSTDRIHGLFIYDENGQWLATSEPVDLRGFNNSDREYFAYHRSHNTHGVLIGDPVRSRAANQWIITVSRRFNHPDGTFAGVVLATLDVDYFTKFYAHFDLGRDSSIALLSTSGILLARYPEGDSYVGRDMSSTPLFRAGVPLVGAGSHEFRSPLDGRERLSFYHTGERYPLMVLATQARETVLDDWWRGAAIRMSFVVTLTIFIAIIGWHHIRELSLRQRMTGALAAREADFRLLAEESSDVVMRIGFDETLHYVSPSAERVLGWSADKLVGGNALVGVNPEDRSLVERTVAGLKTGAITEAKLLYRTRHREKTEIWLETTMRVTRSSTTGAIDGVVAISRDMSDHKDVEDRLAELAATDALTGIGNRRAFNERLSCEWERAHSEGSNISLLLIDLDHFKKFNDRYGHLAGDACLKAVAVCVAGQATRPSDFVARYGGEELAVILADTDHDGCESVAQRILQAVRQLALPHLDNLPEQTVTVSIGGATRQPASHSDMQPVDLIVDADVSLYRAKENGRNRVVAFGQVIPLRRTSA